MPNAMPLRGVGIAATGSFLPERLLTNAELERMMDTSDEWIVQRTGVRVRHLASGDESTHTMAARALERALTSASMRLSDLDLLIVASATPEMACPSVACRVLGELAPALGSSRAGAFDLMAACSGFVYGMNVAHEMIRGGGYRTVAVVGAEHLSRVLDYTTKGRGTSIIFGDGAGAAILRANDDGGKGIIAQALHSDGERWVDLFIPQAEPRDFPGGRRDESDDLGVGIMRMNGRAVFKFAVTTFCDLIQQTLDRAGLSALDVDHYICHQSNIRILEAARERFGLPADRLATNIECTGNTSAASVPILFDQQRRAGRVRDGQRVMFVAFGGGLTWTSSLWQL